MSVAADTVWVMSNKQTLNIRGSFYNMTDDFYNPSIVLGEDGLANYWPGNEWYSSLYNSGYVYYPALDVTTGTGTNTNNRMGRQGREWYQHPNAWTMSGPHELVRGRAQHEVRRRRPRVLRPGARASSRSTWCSTRRSPRTAPTPRTW